jgi:hypothetical protein
MTNKRLYYWLAQILGWGGIFGINAFVNYSINGYDMKNVTINLVIALFGILLTDLFRWILIKFNWLENGNGKLIMKSIGLTLVFSIVHFFLYDRVRILLGIPNGSDVGSELQKLPEIGRIILSVLSVWMYHLLWGIFYFSFHFAYKSRQASMKNLKLEALQTEIELNNLKSQLNPHFMFNSLNSIRALVDIEPAAAKQSITQLSNILRGSLQMGRKTTVPIADELELVENYLKMEKIRFEERLQYDFDIDDSLLNFEIPPLVIQTLVENGIKHGISSLIKGGKVSVQIKRVKGKASIVVINDGKLKEVNKDAIGIGLENTKRRLDLVFGKKSQFKLSEENAQVKAQVLIEI